jgi:TolB-like protein
LRIGSRARVSARLVEAESELCLWADSYEGRLEAVFELLSDAARRFAVGISRALTSPLARTS